MGGFFSERVSVNENLLTREEIVSFLRMHKRELEQKFGVCKIALFGSFARNQAKNDSDVDLMIETKFKSYDAQFELKEFLESHFNHCVDLCSFDSVRPFIMRSIQEELIYA